MADDIIREVLGSDWMQDIRDNFSFIETQYPVKNYFVDNQIGTSGDGSLWKNAFSEPSEAITAWEAWRLLQDNVVGRGRIYIRGTNDAYAALSALPSYCDMIGVGADPRGHGAGIARIGLDTGVAGGIIVAGTARGLNMANLQLNAGNGSYPFKITNIFRSRFFNCAFGTSGVLTGAAPAVGFEVDKAGGLVIDNCHWINNSSKLYGPVIGMNITGTHFNSCLVKNSFITGVDFGVVVAAGCVFGYNSVFRDNFIGEAGQVCAVGVDDKATDGWIQYINNYVAATAAGQLANNGTMRWIANKSSNGFSTVAAE